MSLTRLQIFRDVPEACFRVLWLAAVGVAVLLFQSPSSASEHWVRLASPNEFYVAWMPEQPEVTRSSHRSPVGRATSVGFELERDAYGCYITSTQLPAAVRWFGGERWVYSSARASLLSRASGTERSYRDWQRSGISGKALEWSDASGDGRAEIYVDRGHLHVFSCFAETESASLVDEFFARLSLSGGE